MRSSGVVKPPPPPHTTSHDLPHERSIHRVITANPHRPTRHNSTVEQCELALRGLTSQSTRSRSFWDALSSQSPASYRGRSSTRRVHPNTIAFDSAGHLSHTYSEPRSIAPSFGTGIGSLILRVDFLNPPSGLGK